MWKQSVGSRWRSSGNCICATIQIQVVSCPELLWFLDSKTKTITYLAEQNLYHYCITIIIHICLGGPDHSSLKSLPLSDQAVRSSTQHNYELWIMKLWVYEKLWHCGIVHFQTLQRKYQIPNTKWYWCCWCCIYLLYYYSTTVLSTVFLVAFLQQITASIQILILIHRVIHRSLPPDVSISMQWVHLLVWFLKMRHLRWRTLWRPFWVKFEFKTQDCQDCRLDSLTNWCAVTGLDSKR